jgi:SanA protein
MDAAIELYNTGAAQKILVSGDKRIDGYDEPGAMMAYAIQRGVAAEAIQADYGGRRTYDTCYRARHVFQIESALLITQEFHLPRAMFTCSNLGIEVEGIAADMRPYRGSRWYELRETVAGVVAIWDVMRRQAPPVLAAPLSAN